MRKSIYTIVTSAMICLIVIACASAVNKEKISLEAAEQTLLRLLYEPISDAIKEYYGEHRQYMEAEILSVQRVPDLPYYKVVLRVNTFYGPHNPPLGIETMSFYVKYGGVELHSYVHQDEPN